MNLCKDELFLSKKCHISECAFENMWGTYKASIYHPIKEEMACPAIVISHGWLAQKEWYTWVGKIIANQSYVALLFSVPSRFRLEPLQWSDGVISAINYLLNQNLLKIIIDSNRIGAIGHSMGGLGTLIAANQDSRIKCAVGLAPAILPNLFTFHHKFEIPIQLQLGSKDRIIPPPNVKAFYKNLTAPSKELIEITGGNHVQFTDIPFKGLQDISIEEQHATSSTHFIKWFNHYL